MLRVPFLDFKPLPSSFGRVKRITYLDRIALLASTELRFCPPPTEFKLVPELESYPITPLYPIVGHTFCGQIDENAEKGVKTVPIPDKDVVLTTQEAIQYLKISKPTYLKYIRLGRIRAVGVGNGWRVHQSELYRLLNVNEEYKEQTSLEEK